MTRFTEVRYNLENQFQLKEKMACPTCSQELEQPNYECEKCGITLVFYAKT